MKGPLPVCCRPEAFALLGRAAAMIKAPDALHLGATAIAVHAMPDADPDVLVQNVDQELQRYADVVRSKVCGQQRQAILAHLHDVLFDKDQGGFRGNSDDYYNPSNSYLPSVLATGLGLPITLSLVYKIVAERLGLRVWGVGLPGHFLVATEEESGSILLIDPFACGRVLTTAEAHNRLKELFGPEMEWSNSFLKPASNRHWLTRILQNLLHIFRSTRQYTDVAAVIEMEMVLWPDQGHLTRELALVLARIGMPKPAGIWLSEYLSKNPDDPQKTDLQSLVEILCS